MSLATMERMATMTDRRTTFACPEHDLCVCVFISAPQATIGERRALSLPHEYEPWVRALDEIVVQVEHHEAPAIPDGLLVGEVIIAPKDIANRMKMAERQLGSLDEALSNNIERFGTRLHAAAQRDKALGYLIDDAAHATADDFMALAAGISEVADRLDALPKKRRWFH